MGFNYLDSIWLGEVESDSDEDRLGLDASELNRLLFFAEHPELADPIIGLLPDHDGSKFKWGRAQ